MKITKKKKLNMVLVLIEIKKYKINNQSYNHTSIHPYIYDFIFQYY
jgi:hypothetical protein